MPWARAPGTGMLDEAHKEERSTPHGVHSSWAGQTTETQRYGRNSAAFACIGLAQPGCYTCSDDRKYGCQNCSAERVLTE